MAAIRRKRTERSLAGWARFRTTFGFGQIPGWIPCGAHVLSLSQQHISCWLRYQFGFVIVRWGSLGLHKNYMWGCSLEVELDDGMNIFNRVPIWKSSLEWRDTHIWRERNVEQGERTGSLRGQWAQMKLVSRKGLYILEQGTVQWWEGWKLQCTCYYTYRIAGYMPI